MTHINDGTPTYTNASDKEDVNDLIFISQPTVPNFRDFWVGDDNGSDHFIINGVFSYKPIYNKMNEKTVRLFHQADWIDINSEETPEETSTKYQNTAVQDKR